MKKIQVEQQTPQWEQLRKGKITGTKLKKILGTPKARKEFLYEAIAEKIAVGMNDLDISDMEWGNLYESEARKKLEFDKNIKVETFGIGVSDENEDLVYSPDGWVESDKAGVEIKCPQWKNYLKYWLENVIEGKLIPDEYYEQILQAFIVNDEMEKMYFVIYNPLIKIHPIHIMEISRISLLSEIQRAKTEAVKFLEERDSIIKKFKLITM